MAPAQLIILLGRMVDNYNARFEYTRVKLKWLSLLGTLGFPGFYFVWVDLFPQPYESVPLRAAGCLLCAVLYFNEHCPRLLDRYLNGYAFVTMTLCLPFFFTFMMLSNGVSAIWLGSALCAVLYLTLLLDPANLMLSFLSGTGLAIGSHLLLGDGSLPEGYVASLPVFGFALVGGTGLNHSEALIDTKHRIRAVAAVGSSIAHEMRTPLLGISGDALIIQNRLERLLPAALGAQPQGRWDQDALTEDRHAIDQALAGIIRQTEFANTMINMLLMNVSERKDHPHPRTLCSMAAVVTQATERYPFRGQERGRVVWRPDTDFTFVGTDILMIHMLFNLLKNALRACAAAGHGTIEIRLEPGTTTHRLVVRDTGTGIAPDMLPYIFEPFWSGSSSSTNAGIGLAFCQRVVEDIGGTIRCRSEYGSFTEFVVSVPAVPADAPLCAVAS